MEKSQPQIFRGEILHFLDDSATLDPESSCQHFPDGILIVHNGRVECVGPAAQLLPSLPADLPVVHERRGLIMPGFIDCHVHYPQIEMVAAYGEQLLAWLQSYTFPTEHAFSDTERADRVAHLFFDELLRNGTTTALALATVHPQSADAFFSAARRRRMRMICGKVLMDRNAPPDLRDTPQRGYRESRALIERWHAVDRLGYAVTPRFAPSCSEAQLARAGRLLAEFPGIHLHTHLAENRDEVAWVAKLFPWSRNYLDVYARFGLLGRRSMFAHCIQLSDAEFQLLGQSGSAIAFCPTSNLFLGSGLFNLARAEEHGIRVGLATDIGAGTSFSLLTTINEAYKILQLQGQTLTPLKAYYMATLGGARALGLQDAVGSFQPGKEADFIILDTRATPLLELRLAQCRNLTERLFALAMLGDDRVVKATYILGRKAYDRESGVCGW